MAASVKFPRREGAKLLVPSLGAKLLVSVWLGDEFNRVVPIEPIGSCRHSVVIASR